MSGLSSDQQIKECIAQVDMGKCEIECNLSDGRKIEGKGAEEFEEELLNRVMPRVTIKIPQELV